MSRRKPDGQGTLYLGHRASCICAPSFGSLPSLVGGSSQAMRVLIPTHYFCLLGTVPQTLLNAAFHCAAARSANAVKGDAKTPPPFGSDSRNGQHGLLCAIHGVKRVWIRFSSARKVPSLIARPHSPSQKRSCRT